MQFRDYYIFTIDLEDNIFAQASSKSLPRDFICKAKENLMLNTRSILDLLGASGSKATFFALGSLAEEMPELVKEISDRGSEVACHGFYHTPLDVIGPKQFYFEIDRATQAIQKASGKKPIGFRAPYFSMNKNTIWALEVLKELGYVYDSSTQPFGLHPRYGSARALPRIHQHPNGLLSVPMSVASFHGIRVPCSGGAYFRAYPFRMFEYLFDKSRRQNGHAMFYVHPWEMRKTESPISESFLARQRRQFNADRTRPRIKELLDKNKFVSVSEYIQSNTLMHNG